MRSLFISTVLLFSSAHHLLLAQDGIEDYRPRLCLLASGGSAITLDGQHPGFSVGLGVQLDLQRVVALRVMGEFHESPYRELSAMRAAIYTAANDSPQTRSTALIVDAVFMARVGRNERLTLGAGVGGGVRRFNVSYIESATVELTETGEFLANPDPLIQVSDFYVVGLNLSPQISYAISDRLSLAMLGRFFIPWEFDTPSGTISTRGRFLGNGGMMNSSVGDLNRATDGMNVSLLLSWRLF